MAKQRAYLSETVSQDRAQKKLSLKTRSFMLAIVVLLLAGLAAAQGEKVTATPVFSATFNGPVKTFTDENEAKTSSDDYYQSFNKAKGIEQTVIVRHINADIPVDQSSLDYYADQATKHGEILDDRRNGTIQGHIYTYVNLHNHKIDNVEHRKRLMAIILSPRLVMFLMVMAPPAQDDGGATDFAALTDSLTIKTK
jgi:hypothetical protein